MFESVHASLSIDKFFKNEFVLSNMPKDSEFFSIKLYDWTKYQDL